MERGEDHVSGEQLANADRARLRAMDPA
jgi:hypothetical protein